MIKIRTATIDDAQAISSLVTKCTQRHIGPTLSQRGLKRLVKAMSVQCQLERITGDYKFYIAMVDGNIVGTSAFNPPNHLYYLFVRTDHHGCGIGKQLFNTVCECVSESSDSKTISVNSSLNSVPFYRRMGFVETGPIKNDDEIVFQPMQFDLSQLSKS